MAWWSIIHWAFTVPRHSDNQVLYFISWSLEYDGINVTLNWASRISICDHVIRSFVLYLYTYMYMELFTLRTIGHNFEESTRTISCLNEIWSKAYNYDLCEVIIFLNNNLLENYIRLIVLLPIREFLFLKFSLW